MKAHRRAVSFSVTATIATAALVGFVGVAAWVGHNQANGAREEAKSGHHMASLAEIQAIMKKAQESER